MGETLSAIPTIIKGGGGACLDEGGRKGRGSLIYFLWLEKSYRSNMSKALNFLFIVSFYSLTVRHLLKQYKMQIEV